MRHGAQARRPEAGPGALRWCVQNRGFPVAQIASGPLAFFIFAVTIVVVAVPEGLPLAVTISLAYRRARRARTDEVKGSQKESHRPAACHRAVRSCAPRLPSESWAIARNPTPVHQVACLMSAYHLVSGAAHPPGVPPAVCACTRRRATATTQLVIRRSRAPP